MIRVKNATPDEFEPFNYCRIKNIYIHNDEKIFEVEVMMIITYHDNIRAIQVATTDQTLWCLYTDFYYHGILHIKTKAENMFIIDKQFWTSPF